MGYVMGNVTVARFADGNFWAVFGNGYASTGGKAVLFMVRVDAPGTVEMIDVGGATGNGLSTPTLVDSNGDRIIDMIYAGDLKGNVWKFDVSGSNTATWKSAYLTGSTPKPLFTAKDGSSNPQPITSPVEVGLAPSGASGLMVYFGTGKYFETGDELTKSVQSMYGIVDSDSAFGTTGNNRDQLVLQSIIYEGTAGGNAVRVMSDNTVTYPDDKGWVIDLLTPPSTAKGERVISVPRLFGGRLLFQSIIPSLSPCDYGGASWLMQVNPATGGQAPSASFDINGDGLFNNYDQVDIGGGVMANASGVDFGIGISGGFGSPISAGGTAYVPRSGTGDGGGGGGGGLVDPPSILGSSLKSRASWRQIQ
jgi:type IV pilus assembly protein PilY1